MTMTQGSVETRMLDTKRCRKKVQLTTSTTAAQYVWKSARRFKVQMFAAELQILIIKLASCLKSSTEKVTGLRKQEAAIQRKLCNEELQQTIKWAEPCTIHGQKKKYLENVGTRI